VALTQYPGIRQTQIAGLSPQRLLEFKLLRMSSQSLTEYIDQELERNPLLERDEETGTSSRLEAVETPTLEVESVTSASHIGEELQTSRSALEADLGTNLDNVFPNDEGIAHPESGRDHDVPRDWPDVNSSRDTSYNIEEFISTSVTLPDHLSEQLVLAFGDAPRRLIGRILIDLVDENGYLVGNLDSVAESVGAPLSDVEAVLAVLQGFDPEGVCARNLAECLRIQLRERGRLNSAMKQLINHLDLVARRDFAALIKLCRVGLDELTKMIDEVRRLNPKPGSKFDSAPLQSITADVLVRQNSSGEWVAEVNSEIAPRISTSSAYKFDASRLRSRAEKAYFNNCRQGANSLLRALSRRSHTISKVAGEMVRRQQEFFSRGMQHLHPMTLKDVANAIGMHVSTVSRATTDKYMVTNRGVFELKFLFTNAIAALEGGAAHSSSSVRDRVKRLIDAESPNTVLSDDKIVAILRNEGVEVARRTVTKYREVQGILSSIERRRMKRAESERRCGRVG
jgi:RNA polymerase sigma-54 factor